MVLPTRVALLVLLFCCLGGPTFAVDGVWELNQACAVNTGCLPSDPAGFPVTIADPGSYRLTSNLYSENTGGTVIEVTASGVTIDLNGFEIAPCRPGQLCLTNGLEGYGVKATGRTDVSVVNGTIRNMQRQAVAAGLRGHVESIRAILNGGDEHAGILVGTSSRVVGNVVNGSGAVGISAGLTSTVRDNRVQGNGNWGIFAGEGSVVTGNTVYDNALGGIWARTGSTVRGNSVYSNVQTGIKAERGCAVRENAVADNGGTGLDLNYLSGYGENVLNNNGDDVTGGRPLGANLCDGAPCPAPCATTCANDITVVSRYDVATDSCREHFSIPCAPYRCGQEGSCKTACLTDADCAQGAACDTASGRCTHAGKTCSDAQTVLYPNGTEQGCYPYACRAGGCMERCTLPVDCAPGYVCVANSCLNP